MNDLVIMKSNQALTTSLKVADTFNKKHSKSHCRIFDSEKDVCIKHLCK